jgi:hypothetical protein
MPTSSACSQLHSISPLKANVWVSGATKQSKAGKAGAGAVAHPGEDDAVALDARIGRRAHLLVEARALGLGRLLDALAGGVEQPAVERAPEAAVLEPAEGEVRAAVRAVAVHQAVLALRPPEQHQVLAEQPEATHRALVGQLLDECGRLPVAPHQPAGRGAGADAGDQVVLLLAHHGRRFRSLCEQPFTSCHGSERSSRRQCARPIA